MRMAILDIGISYRYLSTIHSVFQKIAHFFGRFKKSSLPYADFKGGDSSNISDASEDGDDYFRNIDCGC